MKTLLNGIFKESLPGLEKALELGWRRNEAITSNIANAETPGYRAVDVDFGKELDRAFGNSTQKVAMTNPKHLDISSDSGAHAIPDLSGATKPDGNNVDLDIQMGQLAFNRSRYSLAASMVRKKFGVLATAIRQVA